MQAATEELNAWEQLTLEQQQAQQRGVRGQWDTESGRAAVHRPRYCRKCQAWKPPRAHHDSMTGRCVLRMDHYCMWVPGLGSGVWCVGCCLQRALTCLGVMRSG